MIDPLLLTAARILTFEQQRPLTNASGFFFERDERLLLVTSRHVLVDEPTGHYPDRSEIELHTDPDNLGRSTGLSIPLYRDGKSIWRQGLDTAGEIDVAVIEIERSALPDRRADPSGREWLASRDAHFRERPEARRLTVDASRCALVANRSGQPRPAA